ncbi:MAG: LamG domain-containing protein [Planctomycetes bacterium]|nr:LamG domain-containing protein [Planctomycetota bacterium]
MCKKLIYLFSVILVLAIGSMCQAGLTEWETAISGDNPLHWYKFDETDSDCLDSGSAGLNGTYDGVSLAQEGFFGAGTAVGFERTGANRANFENATDMPGPWTVEYIVKTTKPPAANDSQALHDSDTTSIRLAGWTADGEAGFTLYGVADYRFTPEGELTLSDLVIQPDEWMHLVWRNNGNGTQLFFNGQLVATSPDSIDLPRLRIGGRGAGPADHLNGVLDEAVVFDRALSDADIIAHAGAASLVEVNAHDPEPADGVLYQDTWVSLGWSPGFGAASHDVYFSDDFDAVDTRAAEAFQGNQFVTFFVAGFPGFAFPDGLIPGTTYYWRIDEVEADGTTKHEGDVWSFSIPPRTAYNPAPADGTKFVALDASLSWAAGFGSKLHTVYFGDIFEDVNNAAGGIPQSGTTYAIEPLEKDKTYYWRVDEFDAATTHKGNVWSFTTLPDIAITDPSLVGWWKLDEGSGTTAVDWSGNDNHGNLVGNPQWVAGQEGDALEFDGNSWLDFGTPDSLQIAQAITIACWINPAGLGGDRGFVALDGSYAFKASGDHLRFTTPGILDHDAFSAILQVDIWQHVAVTFQPEQNSGVVFYINGFESERMDGSAANAGGGPFQIGNNQWSQTYTGMIDNIRVYNKVLTAEEIQQAMRGDTSLAWNPSPLNRATSDIDQTLPLSWSAGDNASEHDVYFGTDKDAVDNADASDTTGIYRVRQSTTSYNPPEGVEWGGGPYYWRIDEFNTDGTISKGRVWSFAVADYLTVDDFESYNDLDPEDPDSNRIFLTWIDGFDNPATNGSIVGYANAPFAEQTIVHGGRQSMPLFYDNSVGKSEAERVLSSRRDWTREGVSILTIWFIGDSANAAEPMYVVLNGSAGVDNDNPNAAQTTSWTAWNIDLQLFADQSVNLANVNSIAIGFGNRNNPQVGGSGTVFFDDIRLRRPDAGL